MKESDFGRKIQQRVAATADARRVADKRLPTWRTSIEVLGHIVQKWLTRQVQGGLVTIRVEPIEIVEELTGSYKTKRWIVVVGRDRVIVEPIGTFVVGAYGRVDMIGPAARVTLIRTADTTKPADWAIVDASGLTRNTIPLTQQSFHQAFLNVLGEP